jgi:hypothetical protein
MWLPCTRAPASRAPSCPTRRNDFEALQYSRKFCLRTEGALARHRLVRPLRHPSHPASVGLACRRVGAWRRHLVKQINCTGRNSLPGDPAVWDGHVAMIAGNRTMIEARCQWGYRGTAAIMPWQRPTSYAPRSQAP